MLSDVPAPVSAFALAALTCLPVAAAQPARVVLLVRHAEVSPSGGKDPGLSDAGRDRALALVEAVGDAGVRAIVTSQLRRARETAAPVAEALGLTPVEVPATRERGLAGHVEDVADAVRRAEAGVAVLVVGHSNTVPRIIAALGGPELDDIPEDEHDDLFVLVIGDGRPAALVRTRQPRAGEGPEGAPLPRALDPEDPCAGTAFPDQVTSPYVLPYPVGDRHNVRQGNCNEANSHHDGFNETFAYDFEMPIGSTVVAARGGTVLAVIEQFGDDQHGLAEANVVAIDHGDRTYAKYGHLTRNGVLVEVGDEVEAGQPIALSGNSGMSRGPHLHFSVKRCPEGEPIGGPACRTIPVTFRNTSPHPRGLVGSATSAIGGGRWYEALPHDGGAAGDGGGP